MKTVIRPYFNETRGSRFFKLNPGDIVVASEFTFETDALDPLTACEEAFAHFNRDDRPNGRSERSVSVADVLMVSGVDDRGRPLVSWWAVERIGMRKLSQDEADAIDRIELLAAPLLKHARNVLPDDVVERAIKIAFVVARTVEIGQTGTFEVLPGRRAISVFALAEALQYATAAPTLESVYEATDPEVMTKDRLRAIIEAMQDEATA